MNIIKKNMFEIKPIPHLKSKCYIRIAENCMTEFEKVGSDKGQN